MLAAIAGPEQAGKLKPIAWDDVCAQVYLQQSCKLVEVNAARLAGITPESLPNWSADRSALRKRFVQVSGEEAEDGEAAGLAMAVIGSALAVLLINRGGQAEVALVKTTSVSLNAKQAEPFGVYDARAAGKTPAEGWQGTCLDLIIAGIDLGKLEAQAVS